MTETLESRKRRAERKVRKGNDCLKKQKELQREREREQDRERESERGGTLLCTFNFSIIWRKWWGRTILCRERK